jgi:uncharacterized protein (DUF1697 family)
VTVFIAFLRAVNVGGRNTIRMEALRALCADLGLRDPTTHLQSGNLIFASDARDPARLARRLEDAIEAGHGFRTSVILRTAPEWAAVIARSPFADRREISPSRLHVMVLADAPGKPARQRLLALDFGPEEVRFGAREIYIHYPNGVGRSKLTNALIEKTLATAGTTRNWNTATKLHDLATRL